MAAKKTIELRKADPLWFPTEEEWMILWSKYSEVYEVPVHMWEQRASRTLASVVSSSALIGLTTKYSSDALLEQIKCKKKNPRA